MKYTFFIRNHWSRSYGNGAYLLALGWAWQGPQLICWQFHVLGFCFCLFVDGEPVKKTPFPGNLAWWWHKKWYRWKHRKDPE